MSGLGDILPASAAPEPPQAAPGAPQPPERPEVAAELAAALPAAPGVDSGAVRGAPILAAPAGWARCADPAELGALSPAELAGLPAHWAVQLASTAGGSPMVWSCAFALASEARAAGWAVFGPPEVDAIALAAEHARAWPEDVEQWIGWRCRRPSKWRLEPVDACGFAPEGCRSEVRAAAAAVTAQLQPQGWSVARVAHALEFAVVAAWVGPEREERRVVNL